ncbi:MAG: DNA repair protein RecO [Bacilli bacterium]|nr:DNA repair protein RecO [Bacilli bacterium]
MIGVDGIIVSEMAYGDTSKIINILTKEYGIIGIIAKGAKQLKSELRSATDKITYGKFNIIYKKDKLSTLVSVDVYDNFKQIRKDLIKISFASFLIDLSEQVYKQNQNEKILDLLLSALFKINENYDPLVITNIIELKYLDFLGVMPIIDACAVCGSNTHIVTINADKGGYICQNCHTSEFIVTDKTIKLIRMYYYVEISKITKMSVSEKTSKEINYFLDDYYSRYTGLYLKSKTFLKELNRL